MVVDAGAAAGVVVVVVEVVCARVCAPADAVPANSAVTAQRATNGATRRSCTGRIYRPHLRPRSRVHVRGAAGSFGV